MFTKNIDGNRNAMLQHRVPTNHNQNDGFLHFWNSESFLENTVSLISLIARLSLFATVIFEETTGWSNSKVILTIR